jgi:transcriptional regulator of acetoin/glycerol metabolism
MMWGEETLSLARNTVGRAGASARPTLCLVINGEAPSAAPHRWSLDAFELVELGRGAATAARADGRALHVAIADRHVSTAHARLQRIAGGWAIEDAGSKNGILLDGAPCVRARLGDGAMIALGATCLRFESCGDDDGPEHGPAIPALPTLTPEVMAIHARLAAVARSDLPVVLLGETGVGKEITARAVHDASGRPGPLVGVNCGALPPSLLDAVLFGHRRGAFTGAIDHRPGLVRSAHDGTLFLDEVGELSAPAQVALLRVLQEREVVPVGETAPVRVDTRIIAATNRDLRAEVERGGFREDLLARLAGLIVELPPLRDRRSDLGLLIGSLLARVAPRPEAVRITARAVRALIDHDWPQNVRELEMCLRSAGELSGWSRIDVHHLPPSIADRRSADPRRDELVALLATHGGNVAAVARELKTSRMQIHRLLKRWGLRRDAPRG